MSVIVWPTASPTNAPPEAFLEEVTARLAGRVDRAWIFGSYATGEFRPGSDIDLLLVKETGLPFVERASLFNDLYDLYPRLDILVYRREELSSLLDSPVGFWKSVAASMKEIPISARASNPDAALPM